MASYQIDYSDPLRPSFTIAAGGLNGPGASATNSTLRLYGRGALEWGEAVDENQLRLSENFASASPPSSAISGQFWIETRLYYHNASLIVSNGWYRWNFTTSTWDALNGTGTVATSEPGIPSIGQYYYGTRVFDGENVTGLWGYYSLGRYEPAKWCLRSYTDEAGAPGTKTPTQFIRLRDGNSLSSTNTRGAWTTPSSTAVATTMPSGAQPGSLWYDPSTGILRVYSSNTAATGLARWHDIAGPSLGTVATTAHGVLNMGNFRITGLGTPTTSTDAVTKQYVDAAVAGGSGAGVFLPLTGGTLSGDLTVEATTDTANLWSRGAALFFNQRLQQVGDPLGADDAANKAYVDLLRYDAGQTYLDKTGDTMTGPLYVNGIVHLNGTVTLSAAMNATGSIVLSGGATITSPNLPVSANHVANKAYVDSQIGASAGAPPGSVIAFASSVVPAGWLSCDGQAVDKTTYAALYAVLGALYGPETATTFRLPDLRGQFVRGWGNGGPIDTFRIIGTTQTGQIEQHKHLSMGEYPGQLAGWPFGSSTVGGQPGTYGGMDNDNIYLFTNDGSNYTGATAGVTANWNRAGLIGSETRPTNVAMRYIIKY